MKHCVNCEFKLPQHYVEACPYCGLDPMKLNGTAQVSVSVNTSKFSLEPEGKTLLSMNSSSHGTSSGAWADEGQFITRTRVQSSGFRVENPRSMLRPSKRNNDSRLVSNLLIVVSIIAALLVAFQYRGLLNLML